MEHNKKQGISKQKRIGLHYFIDAEHLMNADAEKWSRILNRSEIHWLVINNPINRAIPEYFIKEIQSHNIEIIVNFNLGMRSDFNISSIRTILEVYGKWGVKYACLFQMPNQQEAWEDNSWNTIDVVEAHASQFIEFARVCTVNNIRPIFSPLMPAGDYWDLAFLEKSLRIIKECADPYILKKMVLSALGWFWNRDIDWGAGGNARWPKAKPFGMPKGYQNQMGFRTYQWYLDICKNVIGSKLPIIIFEAGRIDNGQTPLLPYSDEYKNQLASAIGLVRGENIYQTMETETLHAAISNEVIACCFYVLSAEKEKQFMPYRWFSSEGNLLTPAEIAFGENRYSDLSANNQSKSVFKLQRYVYVDGPLKEHMPSLLEALDTYIKRYKPYVGFSLLDAAQSAHLLILTENKEKFIDQHKHLLPEGNITKIISPDQIESLWKA